jgi:hypothetical protein
MTKICYRALPMAHFVTLQSRVFPAYFLLQTSTTILTIATYPPYSLRSLFRNTFDAITLGVMLGLTLLNTFVFGPRTRQAMFDRQQQEIDEGKAYNDSTGQSDEMHQVCRRFSKNHAMSIHLNLLAMVAALLYALRLGVRIKVE